MVGWWKAWGSAWRHEAVAELKPLVLSEGIVAVLVFWCHEWRHEPSIAIIKWNREGSFARSLP